ncbi:MAG: hypothetical protein P8M65_12670 [Roseibacillus sp.]|nr:hypothetical protein [Roseibacillus sp.]
MNNQPFHFVGRWSLLLVGISSLVMLVSCKETGPPINTRPPEGLQERPPVPEPAVVTALKAQAFGSKLLGLTYYLVRGDYVRADLPKAPRYYLLNFSGST